MNQRFSKYFCQTSLKATAALLCAAMLPAATAGKAEARLGEGIGSYKAKISKNFTFKGEHKKDTVTYYVFTMVQDKQHEAASRGFTAGITASVSNGKIVGQSIICRIGENQINGKKLAVAHCLDFMYEAMGKSHPKNPIDAQQESNAFTSAVDQVFAGIPQSVRYPGYNTKITINKSPQNDLLLAATPEAPITIPPTTPPAAKPKVPAGI